MTHETKEEDFKVIKLIGKLLTGSNCTKIKVDGWIYGRVEACQPSCGGGTSRVSMAGGKGAAIEGKVYTVIHALNLRTRMDPPLSQRDFGNICQIAITMPRLDNEIKTVSQVREAIPEIDTEYVKNLQKGEGRLNFIKDRPEKFSKGEVVPFIFTTLCRFPMYEADFGWGKPAWVGSTAMPYRNLVVFLDCKDGGGIEAWANLREEEMEIFEEDEKLLKFASPSFKV